MVMFGTLALLSAVAIGPPVIGTVVGDGRQGFGGDGGSAIEARLDQPFDVAYDAMGNLYLSDTFNHRIRRVDATTGGITTVAGNGSKGFSGDGGPATAAALDEPYGVVLDEAGHLYFADRLNRRVRRVDATTGIITTVAGNGQAEVFGDGGSAVTAGLREPNGVALDPSGRRLYIADVAGWQVRLVDLESGRIANFAGLGRRPRGGATDGRADGDGGPAVDAIIRGARAVAVGSDGTVFILEREGNRLRRVDPETGIITTVAGTGAKGYSGDGGPALQATFDGPKELDIDPRTGRIAIVDTENHTIRLVDPATGGIQTVAGDGSQGGRGDNGSATSAQLDRPHGVAFTPEGDLVIGDTNNHRIRIVRFTDADDEPGDPNR